MTDPADATAMSSIEDGSRRTAIVAALGVAAGVVTMGIGLSLDISPLGGLSPFAPTGRGSLPPLVVPVSEPDTDEVALARTAEAAVAASGRSSIRGADGAVRPIAAGARGQINAPVEAEPAPVTAVETILSTTEEVVTALLAPVADAGGLREWLLPEADEDVELLPLTALPLGLV